MTIPLRGEPKGLHIKATLFSEGKKLFETQVPADGMFEPDVLLFINEPVRLWEPNDPFLYDITFELFDQDGARIDSAQTYAGMRSICISGKGYYINGKPVFQRLVLDQGYYPDGIMTAPDDKALIQDIELSIQAGFNGARLHQKVFEERFLYYADKMGYLVWGEYGDWHPFRKYDPQRGESYTPYLSEWLEILERDYSHPSIIGWCPLNETHSRLTDRIVEHDTMMKALFLATKAMDTTRPVLDTSGYSHSVPETDVYDSHLYTQDAIELAEKNNKLSENEPFVNSSKTMDSVSYNGQPYFISEFGGIWWNPNVKNEEKSWGYGNKPKSVDEVYERFEKLCNALMDNPHMFGYCYTQLTDVFQEQNGIFGFDRSVKFDLDRIRQIQQRVARYEEHYG